MSQMIMKENKITFFKGFAMCIFSVLFFFVGIKKFEDWIRKPKEFVVTKKMNPEKRIITDGIKIDKVLAHRLQ